MQAIFLHDTDTEEIVGLVTPIEEVDFNKFWDEVYASWVSFNSNDLDDDYSIEDFVEFHNENYKLKIDWVIAHFIQL